jgi:hypothetical protein
VVLRFSLIEKHVDNFRLCSPSDSATSPGLLKSKTSPDSKAGSRKASCSSCVLKVELVIGDVQRADNINSEELLELLQSEAEEPSGGRTFVCCVWNDV